MKPVSVLWLPSGGTTAATGLAYRTAISSSQDINAGESFIIDGSLAVPGTNNDTPITIPTFGGGIALLNTNKNYASLLPLKQARTVSIRSNAISNVGVTYTVTGTYLGQPVVGTVLGTAANTAAESTIGLGGPPAIFDTVTSIVPNINMAGTADVGLGTVGQISWIQYDHHMMYPNLSVEAFTQFPAVPAGSITYRFISTLDEISASPVTIGPPTAGQNIGLIVQDGSGAGNYKTIMTGAAPTAATTVESGTTQNAFRYYTIQVTAQAAGFNGTLQATFVQGGIR
jgi:hypothetical protein